MAHPKFYESYGRQADRMLELTEFYEVTMDLLRKIKSGEVTVDQLDIKSDGWHVNDKEPNDGRQETENPKQPAAK